MRVYLLSERLGCEYGGQGVYGMCDDISVYKGDISEVYGTYNDSKGSLSDNCLSYSIEEELNAICDG